MKSSFALSLIVALLVIVAVAIGVANTIRADRRAKTVAERSNRTESPIGQVIYEGPGSVSASEPGSVEGEDRLPPPESAAQRGNEVHRLDLVELRKAVLAGDAAALDRIPGTRSPEDADPVFALIFEIPPGPDVDTEGIKAQLVALLQQIPGDVASKNLLWLAAEPDFLDYDHWLTTVAVLGQRKYRPATSFLEGLGLPPGEHPVSSAAQSRAYGALRVLVALDAGRYLPQIADRVRTAPETALGAYVMALSYDAESGFDIGVAVPQLQSRFTSLSRDHSGTRTWIVRALVNYSRVSKSIQVNEWLIRELRRLIDSGDVDRQEHHTYLKILKNLEP